MKHHVKIQELKQFKKVLFDLRHKKINFKFFVDDKLVTDYTNELINYGMVPEEENKFQFMLCLKKQPSEMYAIYANEINFEQKDNLVILKWTSIDGNNKRIEVLTINE